MSKHQDVDPARAALVGGARDLARQLLLARVRRDADDLARLDVRAVADDQVGEAAGQVGVVVHARRSLAAENGAVRLNAYLARAGVASRRGADELIKAGRVTVDGAPGELNTFVEASERRAGRRPRGRQAGACATSCSTSRAGRSRPRATRRGGRPSSTSSAATSGSCRSGRLDRDTTGVLLLTNDGPLAHRLAHPRYGVEKVYVAEVEGEPDDAVLRRSPTASSSTTGRRRRPASARLGPSRLELVLHEGRNRQVRRMLEAVGHPVVQAAPLPLRGPRPRPARARATGAS